MLDTKKNEVCLYIPVTMPPTGLSDINCWSCFALSSGVILHKSVRSNSRGKCPKHARATNPNVLFTHTEHDFCMYWNGREHQSNMPSLKKARVNPIGKWDLPSISNRPLWTSRKANINGVTLPISSNALIRSNVSNFLLKVPPDSQPNTVVILPDQRKFFLCLFLPSYIFFLSGR